MMPTRSQQAERRLRGLLMLVIDQMREQPVEN